MTPARDELPGTPPAGPEPTLEWVHPGAGIVGAVRARLGSDAHAEAVLVAIVSCLRGWLERDTFEAIVEDLPWSVRGVLRAPEQLPDVPRLEGRDGFVGTAAALLQRTPAQASCYVRAVFATLRAHLPPGLAEACARELPPDVRPLWAGAR